jgi:hypothetical protein
LWRYWDRDSGRLSRIGLPVGDGSAGGGPELGSLVVGIVEGEQPLAGMLDKFRFGGNPNAPPTSPVPAAVACKICLAEAVGYGIPKAGPIR